MKRTAPTAALTKREAEVLRLIADGLSNKQAAERLIVSPETVKTVVGEILSKLDATNRAHAVSIALRSGLLD
jgi:DNA-binding CsgD family transcriptional regulator